MAKNDNNNNDTEMGNQPTNEYPTEEPPTSEHPAGDEQAVAQKPAGEESRYNLSPLIVGFGALMFIAFVFNITAISIGMMDSRSDDSCWSMWGYKPSCYRTWFRATNWTQYMLDRGVTGGCDKADSLMQGARAFSIMSIVGLFLTVIVALLEVMRFADLSIVAVIIGTVTTLANLVSWAAMLAMYWSNLCGSGVFADGFKIGVGLILLITAWCLEMIAIALMILYIATA